MIEQVIFSFLVFNEQFGRKVIPFLRAEYFYDKVDRALYTLIAKHVDKFNVFPNKTELSVEAKSIIDDELSDTEHTELLQKINELTLDPTVKLEWALERTEKFCQDRALYNAINESIQILDKKVKGKQPGVIPQLVTEALSVSFNTSLGHDYLEDWAQRWEYYHHKDRHVPFDIQLLNKITRNGLIPKTLTVLVAGTNVGKSLAMCHFASSHLAAGKNVLYITLEMSKHEIGKRIDANLLNLSMDELELLPKDVFEKKINAVKARTLGKLFVEEYPTSSAGAANFRHLLSELRLKKKFVPDVIYIDYINICCSSRIRLGSSVNSYTYIKAIAEELRGLAAESDVPIVTATQLNREGYGSSDPGLDDTAESFGLPATADLVLAMITNDELAALGQILFKQLKNRYSNPAKFRRFVVGVDYDKMRLYDLEQDAQKGLVSEANTQTASTRKDKFDKFA